MALKVCALITGITGQDGSYLAELLLDKGYEVHGLRRRSSTFRTTERIDHILDRLTLHYGDMTDAGSLYRVLAEVRPDEIYNLAAQSHVGVSFQAPSYTAQATGVGTLHLLDAIVALRLDARLVHASSSEMFGNGISTTRPLLNEDSPLAPVSPYASAKVFAHHTVDNYRRAYGLHASCAIGFNHESPRRGANFVTQKIARAVAALARGEGGPVHLGNTDAVRDWGYAPEYVEAMWRMAQQPKPGDFVLATGTACSVMQWLGCCCEIAGVDVNESYVIDQDFVRPSELWMLRGDAAKAKSVLGWRAETLNVDLAKIMMEAELE